ncbi:dihydroorotate dehydrogenase (NAD+) catalytic subunit [Elusimicrobium posterum]|uniref:dihydroorotate dehydrogenase n=1 Tax=Elusimicrobium posterum TaxID=3116653 RepID=UPI003C717629
MVKVNIAGLELKNPVMTASGTFGDGREHSKFFDLSLLGAVVCKTITLKPRDGNKPPRVSDVPGGMINAIGLANRGVEYYIENSLPFLKDFDTKVVTSIAGNNAQEYAQLAEILEKENGVHAIEVNMSCPNVVHGQNKGLFSQCPDTTKEIMAAVRKVTKKPIFGKISPMVANIGIIAKAVEDAGGDAVALINTIPAMAVDLKTRKPLLGNITGGMSGPALKPAALKQVWEVYNTVKIPIVGMGGIMNSTDALEFILCGATAIEVGTANFVNPSACTEVVEGMEHYFQQNSITDIEDLRGKLKI